MTRLDAAFRDRARLTPSQAAVVDGDGVHTYADLDALANRFARRYRDAGLAPGDRVGIHSHRSARGVAAMLGALRAGVVYVPLDPGSPAKRIRLIAEDCGLRHVVISPQLLRGWLASEPAGPVEHFFVVGEGEHPTADQGAAIHHWAETQAADATGVTPHAGGKDDLAYILYTSGSTGVPKGVMLSHENAVAFVEWAADLIDLGGQDRVASVAPFHFDLSVFDLWATLSRGATIVVVDEVTVLSGRRMLDRIADAKISVWYSVPSALVLMLDSGGLPERGAPSLRVVFFAGEVFPMKHLRATMHAVPQARFFNLFGPTETNVCLAHALPGIPDEADDAIPIGSPVCGDQAFVVGDDGQPVADDQVGELLIDGPTVMLGYWNGGAPTAAPRPYPTGDLVARRADGSYLYHGRRDHMVKVHGFRVELGEVEAALQAHDRVLEAVTFAHEQRLVAVIVPADASLSVLDVKKHCAARLPRYMIPSDIRLVKGLPRTSNGKTDRVGTKAAVMDGDHDVLVPYAAH